MNSKQDKEGLDKDVLKWMQDHIQTIRSRLSKEYLERERTILLQVDNQSIEGNHSNLELEEVRVIQIPPEDA